MLLVNILHVRTTASACNCNSHLLPIPKVFFAGGFGFNALRYHRGFDKISLTHLKRELFEKGICDE